MGHRPFKSRLPGKIAWPGHKLLAMIPNGRLCKTDSPRHSTRRCDESTSTDHLPQMQILFHYLGARQTPWLQGHEFQEPSDSQHGRPPELGPRVPAVHAQKTARKAHLMRMIAHAIVKSNAGGCMPGVKALDVAVVSI
jgi:hypothetical protein